MWRIHSRITHNTEFTKEIGKFQTHSGVQCVGKRRYPKKHWPDLELKKCTECEDLFYTKNALQKHFDKYHGTNGDITRGLPEITKRRKQYFDDIEIEDGEIVNTEELHNSKDDNKS